MRFDQIHSEAYKEERKGEQLPNGVYKDKLARPDVADAAGHLTAVTEVSHTIELEEGGQKFVVKEIHEEDKNKEGAKTGWGKIMSEAIKNKEGEIVLPWQIAQILGTSGKLESEPEGELMDALANIKNVYDEGVIKDNQEIQAAGGPDAWTGKEAKKIINGLSNPKKRNDNNVEFYMQQIRDNWETMGPQNWRKCIDVAQKEMGIAPKDWNGRMLSPG